MVVAVAVAVAVAIVVVVVVVVAFFLFRAISGCFQLAQAIHPLLPRRGRKSLGRGPGRSPSVAKPREMLRPAWRVGWGRLGQAVGWHDVVPIMSLWQRKACSALGFCKATLRVNSMCKTMMIKPENCCERDTVRPWKLTYPPENWWLEDEILRVYVNFWGHQNISNIRALEGACFKLENKAGVEMVDIPPFPFGNDHRCCIPMRRDAISI